MVLSNLQRYDRAVARAQRKRQAEAEATSDHMLAIADVALGALRCAARDRALADASVVLRTTPFYIEADRVLALELIESLRAYPDQAETPQLPRSHSPDHLTRR
jgi:hypothetical protein